jgi:hypothetical protein
MGLVLIAILGLWAICGLGYWYSGRPRRPAPPADLQRADDAQMQEMPTAAKVQERIGEILGETEPLQ